MPTLVPSVNFWSSGLVPSIQANTAISFIPKVEISPKGDVFNSNNAQLTLPFTIDNIPAWSKQIADINEQYKLKNIAEQSFLKYLKQLKDNGITYSLNADGNPKQTNCVIALGEFLKKNLRPDQIKSINWNQFNNQDPSLPLEQRIGGAPKALTDAGLTSADTLTFRQNDKHSAEQRKAFISKFLEMIDSAALCKWDLTAQSTGIVPGNSRLNFKPDEKGRVVGGHEIMLSKKDLELVKDSKTGEVLDVYFRVTGAHWKGDLGVSKARYSLVKDFLEPGNNLTLATLKPEILSAIANNDAQKIVVNNK